MRTAAIVSALAAALFCAGPLPCAGAPLSDEAWTSEVPDFTVGRVLAAPEGPSDPSRPMVRLAVSPFAYPNSHYPLIERTIAALRKVFGAGNFEAYLSSGNPSDIENADLILASTGTYLRMQRKGARDLVTAVSNLAPDPNHAEGSLFITLKSRGDINTFADMKGRRLVTTGPNAFAGYHIGLAEIAARGEDPDAFFSERISTGYDMRRELSALRMNAADVAIVRTCFLEELARSGVDVSDVKPIAVKNDVHPAHCLSSTPLYPNWSVLATPHLPATLAREATLALLSEPRDADGLGWGIATDFRSADLMYRSIRRGPYEYLRTWTWTRFWDEYREWILLALVLVLGLALHARRTQHLVDVRTAELRRALDEQRRTERRAAEAQRRMEDLARAGAVGQMSSMIAHELRQSLSTLTGYAQGVERLLDRPGPVEKDLVAQGVSIMRRQAETAEAIVRRVREYAKGAGSERTELDLGALLSTTADTVNAARISAVPVRTEAPDAPVCFWGDPLELELALENLMKNALEAVAGVPNGAVTARLRLDRAGESPRIVIEVSDNGPRLSNEAFAALLGVHSSSKLDGLGLGLSIVRLIVENHGGQLLFVQLDPQGLCARVMLPEAVKR